MELILVVVMIVSGACLAGVLMLLVGRIDHQQGVARDAAKLPRDELKAAILGQIARLGGAGETEARRIVRAQIGIEPPVGIDLELESWTSTWSRRADRAEREELLELAARTAVGMNPTIPLRQYDALMSISFTLGFHSDALARLRARYRFEFVDRGRNRLREGAGSRQRLFQRRPIDESGSLRALGLTARVSRQQLVSLYRQLAARHHPDRFHNAPDQTQEKAAAEFIRITEAYEDLLPFCDDD